MISIKNLIRPFRSALDPNEYSDRSRLCEAFESLEDAINDIIIAKTSPKHYAKVYSAVNVNIPTGVPTPIPFASTFSQVGGLHSNTSQNTRITIFRAGLYQIIANVQWPAFAAGIVQLQILVNGANIIGSRLDYPQAVPAIQDQIVAGADYFEIGNYIEIIANQTSGGPLVIPPVANFSPIAFVGEL